MIIFNLVRAHPCLNARILIPVLPIDLIAADMKVAVRKELLHFAEDSIQQFVRGFLRGIKWRAQIVVLRTNQSLRRGGPTPTTPPHPPHPPNPTPPTLQNN